MSWPRLAKFAVAFALPAAPAFFLGQLLPQGVARIPAEKSSFVPWALAINATAGTIAAGLGVLLAHTLGLRSVVILGAACYIPVAFMARARNHSL